MTETMSRDLSNAPCHYVSTLALHLFLRIFTLRDLYNSSLWVTRQYNQHTGGHRLVVLVSITGRTETCLHYVRTETCLHYVLTGSRTYPFSYRLGAGSCLPGDKGTVV
jgi:hypothetical protein